MRWGPYRTPTERRAEELADQAVRKAAMQAARQAAKSARLAKAAQLKAELRELCPPVDAAGWYGRIAAIQRQRKESEQ